MVTVYLLRNKGLWSTQVKGSLFHLRPSETCHDLYHYTYINASHTINGSELSLFRYDIPLKIKEDLSCQE